MEVYGSYELPQSRKNRTINSYFEKEGIGYFKITKGMTCKIDPEDFDKVKNHSWCAVKGKKTFYAQSRISKNELCFIHNIIMDAKIIDHINGDGLDNRKSNLRKCTITQNNRNRGPSKRGTSSYKGVCWSTAKNKWRANIMINKKQTHLGYFETEKEAAKSYDEKAKEIYKEYAWLNFKD